MKLKVVVCLLAFLSFRAASAFAQDVPKFDVFAGYSYVRDNPSSSGVSGFNLHGGSASVSEVKGLLNALIRISVETLMLNRQLVARAGREVLETAQRQALEYMKILNGSPSGNGASGGSSGSALPTNRGS